eukprot:SM000215S06728  [mRNA]  locus=s215:91199:91630:- [translate_table: standard]
MLSRVSRLRVAPLSALYQSHAAQPAEMSLPAACLSLLQRRVLACLQRARASALHQKAGRALVGGRRAPFLASSIHASISDLHVLMCGY